jgi:NADPH:quinone reductase-like Zn-dependent oxidoreductase
MKAVRIREHGDFDVLRIEALPEPKPSPGELLVAIKAAGINHLDTWVRRGVPGHSFPLPITPGSDGAGEVVALGEGVTGYSVGDRVAVAPGYACGNCDECHSGRDHYCGRYGIYGESGDGTQCELFRLPVVNALPLPADLGFNEAAAIPLVFLTAWEMLIAKGRLHKGNTVLIHAAGSGVSSAAIQIARHFGARVIATASSDAKLDRAKDLGADETVNYGNPDWPQVVRGITAKRGCDLVIDHVGAMTFPGSLRSLAAGGRLLCCGASSGHVFSADLRPIFFKNQSIIGSTMGAKNTLPEILRLTAEGVFKAVIDTVMPMSEVAAAHRRIAERAQFGKIVLRP